ncbi:sensor histidine kinase [Winogradskyella vincentii]|uniref:Histidine kinase n=1 Tax=Winogradskyella vincentii TaxID=2877122 RepID=A0ABS7XYZ5_9FLAO|nr:histidine kinase [Winogradskyella vincentii]MCA0152854.1 histidine kinase [Winogradskyella vincentii]
MVYLCVFISFTLQKEISTEIISLIAYVAFFVLALIFVFVVFFTAFQRRKNQLLLDKINQQKAFDEELVKSQQEIQEATLKHVGRELHDNVGQLLAFTTMQLKAFEKVAEKGILPKLTKAQEAVASSLTEVRALSRSLNNDVILNAGFNATVKNEIERLNNSGLIEASFNVFGENANFENGKDEIILFRILQEFFSNTLKYANADKLEVNITYSDNDLVLSVSDDGDGFDFDDVQKSSGLINMEKRSELINAEFNLTSQKGKGTQLKIKYPYRALS